MLGVQPRANAAHVRHAKNRRVLLTHPDKTDCPGAEQAFELVVEASDVLLNSSARKQYDAYRKQMIMMAKYGWSELDFDVPLRKKR